MQDTADQLPAHPSPSPAMLVVILLTLMALLGVTTAVAFVDVDRYLGGRFWSLSLALLIALIKAALVIAYFMHVRFGARVVGVFAVAGFVWLGIMIVLMSTDYLFQ